LAKHFIKDNTL